MERLKRLLILLFASALLLFFPAVARSDEEVETQFISLSVNEVTLAEMMQGKPGRGILLFYPDGRSPERPALVVLLQTAYDKDEVTARVYDDRNGNGYVDVDLQRDEPAILEPYSAVFITTLEKWWVRDGMPNYNLNVDIFGPVCAMWGTGPECGAQQLPGMDSETLSVRIRARDPQYSGLPQWDLRSLITHVPTLGVIRTNYAERKCHTPVDIVQSASPAWPYVALEGEYLQETGKFHPPIIVDWEESRIVAFAELVPVRAQNCSYSLYSIHSLLPQEHNSPNFETPFAFYDLSGQGEGFPNLVLRSERSPAGDPWLVIDKAQPEIGSVQDFETIRYSWRNAVGDGFWDYKVEVMGFHPYEYRTPIADGLMTIDAPPYELFPTWVIEREWPAVTFVDTEGNSYFSGEGIYEWSPILLGNKYIFGRHENKNLKPFTRIRRGFRGEYRFQKNQPPLLYLSPIDNRLHLLGAEGGTWNLQKDEILSLHNLDEGPHINGWVRKNVTEDSANPGKPGFTVPSEEEEIKERLYALDGYLIYSNAQTAEIRRTSLKPALFTIAPPTDKNSWLEFREQTAPYTSQKRDPHDLRGWMDAFEGETLSIAGGQISGVRMTGSGFRFVLQLQTGFQVQGAPFFSANTLQPGQYVVAYDGQFTIEPLTPPALSLTLSVPEDAAPVVGDTLLIRIEGHNQGGEDVEGVILVGTLEKDGKQREIERRSIDLLSGVPAHGAFNWQPESAGTWTVTYRLEDLRGNVLAQTSVSQQVAPSPEIDMFHALALSTNRGQMSAIIVALLMFLGLIGLAVRLVRYGRSPEAFP